jgi:uncharacterized protein YicC (UPF0701 family)
MEALLEKEGTVENWNDERLDELSRRMDKGFEEAATKVELSALKNEINLRFDRVDERFDRVDEHFKEFDGRLGRFEGSITSQISDIGDRLDRLSNAVIVGAFALIAAVIANGIWG